MRENLWDLLVTIGVIPTWEYVLGLAIVLPAIFALLESRFSARSYMNVPRRSFLLNLTYWFVNPLLLQVGSKLAVCGICAAIALIAGWELNESLLDGFGPLARQPVWLQAIEILLVADFIDYWTHRTFHSRPMWRFHAIHHSAEQMTWLASARMHPVNDIITRICQVVPIVLLGLSIKAALIVVPFLVFFVILLHSNLHLDYGVFRWVLVSPLYHRWHHTSDSEGLDKNFAGIFPIWDLVFGTAYFPHREPVRFGVTRNPPPESLWGQVLYPFRAGGDSDDREHERKFS